MDTSQNEKQTEAEAPPVTEAEENRDEHQREQVEAQAAGDTGAELKAFAKEILDDHAQYPSDVVKDSKDPDRRVDEEQGTTTQPGAEPAEDS
jgi:hypothetical protein